MFLGNLSFFSNLHRVAEQTVQYNLTLERGLACNRCRHHVQLCTLHPLLSISMLPA